MNLAKGITFIVRVALLLLAAFPAFVALVATKGTIKEGAYDWALMFGSAVVLYLWFGYNTLRVINKG